MGTQKNRLNETVLLVTQNICSNSWVRKYLQFYADFFCLSKPVCNLPALPKIHLLLNAERLIRGNPLTIQKVMSLMARFTRNILEDVRKFFTLK